MATVDPRAFDWGTRIMQGMEQGRERKLQDEDRMRQEEERKLRMQALQQSQTNQQKENEYAQHIREAQTIIGAKDALKKIPLERRRQALESWAKTNPVIGGIIQYIPPETDLSDNSLDELGYGMGAVLQQYKSPQVNSDFLRAMEILKNPNASEEEKTAAHIHLGIKPRAGAEVITPYQQAQIDLEQQKLKQKTEADATKANEGKGQKIRDAVGIVRAKQMYAGIDAARGTLASLDELDQAIKAGAQFGPIASRAPSFTEASQRGDRALANLALSNIKQLPGPASDRDIAFIKQASISDKIDQKTMSVLIPKLKEAAARVIEKNTQVATLIEQGFSPAEAEKQVWQQQEISDDDLINKYLR